MRVPCGLTHSGDASPLRLDAQIPLGALAARRPLSRAINDAVRCFRKVRGVDEGGVGEGVPARSGVVSCLVAVPVHALQPAVARHEPAEGLTRHLAQLRVQPARTEVDLGAVRAMASRRADATAHRLVAVAPSAAARTGALVTQASHRSDEKLVHGRIGPIFWNASFWIDVIIDPAVN